MIKVKLIFFFTRLFFGKYSPRYYFVYKKHVNKSAYRPCYRDSFIAHIENLMEKSDKNTVVNTDQVINFAGFAFGSPIGKVRKKRGEPYFYTVEKAGKKFLKAIGYNEDSGQMEIKVVYYFNEDRLFMGEYIFPESDLKFENNLNKSLEEKYSFSSLDGISKFIIKDPENSIIITENNGFEIIVKYFCTEDKESYDIIKGLYTKYKDSGIGKTKKNKNELLGII